MCEAALLCCGSVRRLVRSSVCPTHVHGRAAWIRSADLSERRHGGGEQRDGRQSSVIHACSFAARRPRVLGRLSRPKDRMQRTKLEISFGHTFDRRGVSSPESVVRACVLSVFDQPSGSAPYSGCRTVLSTEARVSARPAFVTIDASRGGRREHRQKCNRCDNLGNSRHVGLLCLGKRYCSPS
jgi:hypothetical protein